MSQPLHFSGPRPAHGYQVFMLVLCVYSLGLLAYQATSPPPEVAEILGFADVAVCALFFADFVFSFIKAENRWRYMVTWGWIDLLSSIPAVDIVRWGRLARILRIFRVLRGLRAAQMITSLVVQQRARNTVMAACLAAIMLITFCSISILYFEAGAGNIRSAEDAVWWAFTTITTVGYGDRYPTTVEGRMIAVLLMSGGVGLFGTFSGFLASWFSGEEDDATTKEVAALRAEIAQLSQQLSQRSS